MVNNIHTRLLNKCLHVVFVIVSMMMIGNTAKTSTTPAQPTWKPITSLAQTMVTQPSIATPVTCLLVMSDPASPTGDVLLSYNGAQLTTTPVKLPLDPSAVYANSFFNITPLPTAHQYVIQDVSDMYMLVMPPMTQTQTGIAGRFSQAQKQQDPPKFVPFPPNGQGAFPWVIMPVTGKNNVFTIQVPGGQYFNSMVSVSDPSNSGTGFQFQILIFQ